MPPRLHVALFRPLIPHNTGNVGRTCLGVGARLHLIEPLGFQLDDKQIRRAGLDYWPRVDLQRHPSWEAFVSQLDTSEVQPYLVSKAEQLGEQSLYEEPFAAGRPPMLIFGNESAGLREADLGLFEEPPRAVYIPMDPDIRSYNLSTAVGMVAAVALSRGVGGGVWGPGGG